MKYQVFEMSEPCSVIAQRCKLDESWHQDTFDDAQKAEFYASAWACGRMDGPRDAMWEALKTLPFRMDVGSPQYIKGCVLTIKEIKEDVTHA
ncbi:hypothetical protein D3C87_323320 [compost metagenome]